MKHLFSYLPSFSILILILLSQFKYRSLRNHSRTRSGRDLMLAPRSAPTCHLPTTFCGSSRSHSSTYMNQPHTWYLLWHLKNNIRWSKFNLWRSILNGGPPWDGDYYIYFLEKEIYLGDIVRLSIFDYQKLLLLEFYPFILE